jgi:hypothetical protein
LLGAGPSFQEIVNPYSALDGLMKNNLSLNKAGFGAGEGVHQAYFLCITIDDEDTPWDVVEID